MMTFIIRDRKTSAIVKPDRSKRSPWWPALRVPQTGARHSEFAMQTATESGGIGLPAPGIPRVDSGTRVARLWEATPVMGVGNMAYADRGNIASSPSDDDGSERDVVMQFARILRLQANMLERDGDLVSAHALRRRVARSLREVAWG